MKVSYNWIKDFVDINMKPEKVASQLTMAGLEVISFEKTGNDYILEIEITPNRADCLSVIGIAREIAAITGKKLSLPKLDPRASVLDASKKSKKTSIQYPASNIRSPLTITIQDKTLCPIYTGRVISNVTVRPSPQWLARRLQAVGIRPLNNIVDITNYCLMEFGQPLHAFDYDKLTGSRVIVRRAQAGERIATIDGVERVLGKDILVIADKAKPIAIAGVMGGRETEVTDATRNILLESAFFDPVVVRRASMSLGVATESSYRFERGVDPEGVTKGSDRAIVLICQLASSKKKVIVYSLGSIAKRKPSTIDHRPSTIFLRFGRIGQILGVRIPIPKVKQILRGLGFGIRSHDKYRLQINIPSFRQDIAREIDLIEEVARMYGYDKIPLTLPRGSQPIESIHSRAQREPSDIALNSVRCKAEEITRTVLTGSGLHEVITHSLISEVLLQRLHGDPSQAVRIKNPSSWELELMRPTIIPTLLAVVAWNVNRKRSSVKVFELGNIYYKTKEGVPRERKALAIAMTGRKRHDWSRPPWGESPDQPHQEAMVSFFDVKGVVENVLERLGIAGYEFVAEDHPGLIPSSSASLKIGESRYGFIGEVEDGVREEFDIPSKVYVCQLEFEHLLPKAKLEKKFSPLPKYLPIRRDLAVMVTREIPSSRVASTIAYIGGDLIAGVELFEQYCGEPIPAGYKSLAYSVQYQSKERTLTHEEIAQVHSKICQQLVQELSARIR